MAQSILTLTTAGLGTGPFDLYTNLDGFFQPFATNIPRSVLLSGYTLSSMPVGTTSIQVRSNNGTCSNFTQLAV